MGTMSTKDGRWYLSCTAGDPGGDTGSYVVNYTLNTKGKFIDKDIRIEINAATASFSSYTGYKYINSAGWSGKQSGNNSGTSYNISGTMLLGPIHFANGGTIAYYTFSCANKLATDNISLLFSGMRNRSFSSPSGYILKPGSTTYMCECAMNYTKSIKSLCNDGATWYVLSPRGNTYVNVMSTTINSGNGFRIGTHTVYTAGHYVRTPGGQYWVGGYDTTYYDLYINGSSSYTTSTSGTWDIYAKSDTNIDKVVYVYK